jgi:hypothetical protein
VAGRIARILNPQRLVPRRVEIFLIECEVLDIEWGKECALCLG